MQATALKDWNETGQLPALKFMRTLWICAATGGPFTYTGKDMSEAHKGLNLESEEFDEVGAEIASALDPRSRRSWPRSWRGSPR